jgi:hypothetical protein
VLEGGYLSRSQACGGGAVAIRQEAYKMTLKMVPVEFECYETDMEELVFKVKAFDQSSANVEIETVVNVESWDEMAPLIRAALVAMKLE